MTRPSVATIVYVILLFSCLSVSAADDRRIDKSKLVVMTLNAEFLWDGVSPEEGQVSFPWKGSKDEAEEHMQEIAEIVIGANPDILNLVEVEGIDALTTFNEKFLNGRGYKPYLITGKDTYTGEDVGLLTRIDPDQISRDSRKGVRGTVQKEVSKNYFALLTIENEKVALIGLHFLARPNDESRRLEREAQAEAIRRLAVEKAAEGYEIIIFGDFNDYDGEDGSRDHIDSTPISEVLSLIREMTPANATDNLINASSRVPKPLRYTAHYDKNQNNMVEHPGELTSIDHVLLSKGLADRIETVEIPHNYNPVDVTDHFPIVVRLKMDSGTPTATNSSVRIVRILPNPQGDEAANEEVTLKNFGNQSVNVTGWKVRDVAGKTWKLDALGTISPTTEKTLKRNGQPMSLNNNGDTVDLLDSNGIVTQSVTYSSVQEGEEVLPP